MSESGGIKARVLEETKTILWLWVYLMVLLGAMTTYRKLLLEEYSIGYFQYGFVVVEALILAKVIVIGRMLRVGERFGGRPLVVPTLWKTFMFSLFAMGFTVLEHVVEGVLHRKDGREIWEAMMSKGVWEILTRVFMLFMALLPLFAVWEIDKRVGKGKVAGWFFGEKAEEASP